MLADLLEPSDGKTHLNYRSPNTHLKYTISISITAYKNNRLKYTCTKPMGKPLLQSVTDT